MANERIVTREERLELSRRLQAGDAKFREAEWKEAEPRYKQCIHNAIVYAIEKQEKSLKNRRLWCCFHYPATEAEQRLIRNLRYQLSGTKDVDTLRMLALIMCLMPEFRKKMMIGMLKEGMVSDKDVIALGKYVFCCNKLDPLAECFRSELAPHAYVGDPAEWIDFFSGRERDPNQTRVIEKIDSLANGFIDNLRNGQSMPNQTYNFSSEAFRIDDSESTAATATSSSSRPHQS